MYLFMCVFCKKKNSKFQSVHCSGYFKLCLKQLREHFIASAAKWEGSYHWVFRPTYCSGREVAQTTSFQSSASPDYPEFTWHCMQLASRKQLGYLCHLILDFDSQKLRPEETHAKEMYLYLDNFQVSTVQYVNMYFGSYFRKKTKHF